MYIKELCTENKVDVAVLGCYLNLCNPNPEKHKEIVEKYKAHIRFASILGCGVVGTETGAVNEEYKYELLIHLIFRLYLIRLTCYVLIILHSRMRLLRKHLTCY